MLILGPSLLLSLFAMGFNCSLTVWYILSSAPDGPDLLIEELDLVRNMNLAVEEERYNDAGIQYNNYDMVLFLHYFSFNHNLTKAAFILGWLTFYYW